ncbi:MAG: hypothetical protein LUE27_02765 [Clostridia bacterium]|nr:hypothetical protein [Clostridia bacterium]
MAESRGKQKTTKKRRKYLRATSPEPMYSQLGLLPGGRFSEMDLNVLGLNEDAVDYFDRVGYRNVGELLKKDPPGLGKIYWYGVDKNEILNAVDSFFVDYFDSEREKYEANPVPIYELLGINDLKRYMNRTIWTMQMQNACSSVPRGISSLVKSGIVSMYELLKLNLPDFHRKAKLDEDKGREFLSAVKWCDEHYFDDYTTFCAPLDEDEEVPVLLPVPEESKDIVSRMMDDALAGDEVSTEGLPAYEKSLYARTKAAADICGPDFYFDVIESPYKFWKFSKELVRMTGPALQLMDDNYYMACLFNEVPEQLCKLSYRYLMHFSHPHHMYYEDDASLFPYGFSRSLSIEDMFNSMEPILRSARSEKEYNAAYEKYNMGVLVNMMMWAVTATVEKAVDDCMYRRKRSPHRDKWDELNDKIIDYRANGYTIKKTAELTGQTQYYVTSVEKDIPAMVRRYFWNAEHDLFAVLFLLCGFKPITQSEIERLMTKEASYMLWKAVTSGAIDCELYSYSPRRNAVIISAEKLPS